MTTALDDWADLRRGRRCDPAGARRLVEVANAADLDDWRARLRHALGQADRQDRLAALGELRRTGEFEALSATSLGLLGAGLADAGDRESAYDLLRRAQLRHPHEVRLHHALARVLDAMERPEEAIAHYTTARALRPETAHALAHALVARSRTEDAIDVFRDLIGRRPMNGGHAVCLANLFELQGRGPEAKVVIDKAIAASRRAIAIRPDDASAHQALGLVIWARRNEEEAIVEFRNTIRLMPRETAARLYVGRILLSQGRYHEAVQVLREAIPLRPSDAVAHSILGYALTATDQVDEATDAFRTALQLGSDRSEIHSSLGRLFMRRRRWQEGADAYERARVYSSRSGDDELQLLAARPGHRVGINNPTAWYLSAVAHLRAGRIGRFRWLCGEMLRRFADGFEAELVARACLMSPDEPTVVAEAARLAERAVKDLPMGPYTLYTAGLADYRSGLYESALERVGESRKANEARGIIIYRDAYRALTDLVEAMALARLGRSGAAGEALARAERLMADHIPAEGSDGLYPAGWQEWAHCEIIHREAEAVVRWDPIFPADPFAR
jgi:Flp pilus assembly protein TadD